MQKKTIEVTNKQVHLLEEPVNTLQIHPVITDNIPMKILKYIIQTKFDEHVLHAASYVPIIVIKKKGTRTNSVYYVVSGYVNYFSALKVGSLNTPTTVTLLVLDDCDEDIIMREFFVELFGIKRTTIAHAILAKVSISIQF